eukprot:COSAG01_NODE_8959_length_2602_cov_2.975629_2_plen_122_part_00
MRTTERDDLPANLSAHPRLVRALRLRARCNVAYATVGVVEPTFSWRQAARVQSARPRNSLRVSTVFWRGKIVGWSTRLCCLRATAAKMACTSAGILSDHTAVVYAIFGLVWQLEGQVVHVL